MENLILSIVIVHGTIYIRGWGEVKFLAQHIYFHEGDK